MAKYYRKKEMVDEREYFFWYVRRGKQNRITLKVFKGSFPGIV
jgi:hypothetical protein